MSGDPLRPVRPALVALRRRWPRAWHRLRTVAALGEYAVARWRRDDDGAGVHDAYDESFWDGHNAGDWDGFARALVRHLAPRAVVDVGCGDGRLLAALGRVAPAVHAEGLEQSPAAIRRARGQGLRVRPVDLTRLGADAAPALAPAACTAPGEHASVPTRFDVAVCLEVAEHLPAWHAGRLVTLLARAGRVVFSAAQPNQGGTLHVNEQPPEYWARRFARAGLLPSAVDAAFRADVAALALPWWYAANVRVYERRVAP